MATMAEYTENPKTAGSGILCAIPQTGRCPVGCADCFFQSGRSYLEPLTERLPNLPPLDRVGHRVVRVNDGNDSNVQRTVVLEATQQYPLRFYNTSIPAGLAEFGAPVVLTVNPGPKTDGAPVLVAPVPKNLMFVRVRTNTWNVASTVEPAVVHYTALGVPVVLTFMAYFDTADAIPLDQLDHYTFRQRTLNTYYAITHDAWRTVMDRFADNALVHSCGVEGIPNGSKCTHCGNCLREFFATQERLQA